jgi:hypothetical protein
MRLVISNPARVLRHIPRLDLEHIDEALAEMCADPYFDDAEFLRCTGLTFRRSIGNWHSV